MSAPVLLALVLAVAIPVELIRAHRSGPREAERWAHDHGLELTAENRPVVTRYLRHVRVLRTWGGAAGAVVPTLVDLAVSGRFQVLGFGADGESAPLGFGAIFVGYLAGAMLAELTLARPVPAAKRSASLERRELENYLPRGVVLAQRLAAAAGALGLIALGLVPYTPGTDSPGPVALTATAVLVLALGAGMEAVERWIVRRPQPVTGASLVAADDAIRAQSIRALSASALALLLLLCCGIALGLQASEVAALHTTMAVVAAVCLVLALLAFGQVADGRWRVRRPARAAGAESA